MNCSRASLHLGVSDFLWLAAQIHEELIRFSLAGLLVVVTSVAIWLGAVTNKARKQQSAIAKVRDSGGQIVESRPKFKLAPKWLKSVLGEEFFQSATVVDFATNQGRRPGSFQPKASNETLAGMGPLRDIETIELGYNYQVTDAGLEHLQSMTRLKTLYLYRTGVTGTGFRHLSRLPELQAISLAHSKLDDAGMEHLAALSNLTWLRLDNTGISDSGLRHLHSLNGLQDVTLMRTSVTMAGVAELRRALPDCQVIFEEFPREMSESPLFPDGARPSGAELQKAIDNFRTTSGYRMTGVVETEASDKKGPVTGLSLSNIRISARAFGQLMRNQLPDLRELLWKVPR